MSSGIVFHSLAALVYLGLAAVLWVTLQAGKPVEALGRQTRLGLLVALGLQGFALWHQVLGHGLLQINWALALSAALWLGLVIYWLESLVIKIDGIQLLLLPLAGIVCLFAGVYPKTVIIASSDDPALRWHLLLALCAYGIITIAAVQAALMAALDYHLHNPRESVGSITGLRKSLGRMLDVQPPLLTQERLLFRLIWVAFTTLTFTIVTGALITLAMTGKWLLLDHKTVFTLLSWITFAVLLTGRILRGWRGRIALRYTMIGFVFVVLSYSGSRFVVDVILERV